MTRVKSLPQWSTSRILLVVVIVSLIAGSSVGLVASSFAKYQAPQTREFYVFSYFLPFNETKLNLPHDVFYPDRILVYKGDTVTIHFYNIEESTERHSFTIDAPYHIDLDIPNGQNANVTFVTNIPGVFLYYCKYHTPTMEGYLTVLG